MVTLQGFMTNFLYMYVINLRNPSLDILYGGFFWLPTTLCYCTAPFLYIFFLLYTIVGIPVIFLEMAWGQYSNLAPLQAFKIIPAMQGK